MVFFSWSIHLRSSGSSRGGVLVLDLQDVLQVALLDHVLGVRLQTLELDDHVVVDGAGDAAPGVGHEVAVNDEVLEVNGIEVAGRTLDQVTDMMVANSSNLIVTVKPANQRTLMGPRRGSFSRNSNMSGQSMLSNSTQSGTGSEEHDDEDEIRDLAPTHLDPHSHHPKPILHL